MKSKSVYGIDPIEHHLKDAIELNRKIELSPRRGHDIDKSLTSIDIASSPSLGVVSKEIPHPLK
jgi:hypothetical protein